MPYRKEVITRKGIAAVNDILGQHGLGAISHSGIPYDENGLAF